MNKKKAKWKISESKCSARHIESEYPSLWSSASEDTKTNLYYEHHRNWKGQQKCYNYSIKLLFLTAL